jgi:SAM-dependent methyltransferase
MDTLELYRWAVQDPEIHAEVLRIMYEELNAGRRPDVLHEDFAGTAADSVAWVALQVGRRAVAVELDGPTVAWAKRRAERILGALAQNVEFITGNVLEIRPSPAADIITALNYSVLYFRDGITLARYLSNAHLRLAPGGLLVLNLFGGAAATQPRSERHLVKPKPLFPTEAAAPAFEYVWEQRAYNADTSRLDCRIHFDVPDPARPGGVREVRDAFRYDWRLWSVHEVIHALHSAGFEKVEVWRHTYDPLEGPAGLFLGPVPIAELDALDHWSAYVVATHEAVAHDEVTTQ